MAKPQLKAMPQDHKPPAAKEPAVRRANLSGALAGHWTEFRVEMTGREAIALMRASEDQAAALSVVGSRTIAHSFGGDILDQPLATVVVVLRSWTQAIEDDALDPTPASDSDGS